MPRGKYVNHKGRLRQFTPADVLELQMERIHQEANEDDTEQVDSDDLEFDVEEDYAYDYDYHRNRGIGRLIEISNPNRLPRSKPLSVLIKVTSPRNQQRGQEEDATKKRRREKKRERKQCENALRSKESVADLARLALVRKEREAAAQRRLAAKQAAAEAASSSSISLKKISPKSSEDSATDFLARNPKACQRKIRSTRKK
ncbi:28 kDa heat- and acid-stable phosphoprotein-like [Drosophila subpulchrella]|uniref:28 kDa heat- and acid-stable phosphoprotein-like n=1 Tax=Drosophila subpulchrella TaxID=1486046 RepID=UPI0018A1594C|nr:28 kDa heat- and acid-stable phosphoprotein-like [Drosophila subpulchrella]XP_037725215.1 28 kDa heat- and acid-stable phosphoprotein-like [Drosophila subpulchrella]